MNAEQIDETIEQVEDLYHSLTGREAPEEQDEPYAAIPPERDPTEYVEEQMQRLSQALSGPSQLPAQPLWSPPVAIWENREGYLVSVDLPGVARAGVHLALREGTLVISGERKPPSGQKGQLRWSESWRGGFLRNIPLPSTADLTQLRAEMRDGVLEVHIPRTERRDIEVH